MNFQPDKNPIDKVLFDGIVDEYVPYRNPSFFPRVTNNQDGFRQDEFRELLEK